MSKRNRMPAHTNIDGECAFVVDNGGFYKERLVSAKNHLAKVAAKFSVGAYTCPACVWLYELNIADDVASKLEGESR